MSLEKLSKFLLKAKINTYASSGDSNGEGREKILPDGSKEFGFRERKFRYRDRYFDFGSFIGEEIVFQNEKAVWGMNYYGEIVSEIVPPEQIYNFLREALKKVTEDKPFRGPDSFKKDDFEYINKADGTVEKFVGQETILYKKQPVYKLNYHGGLVVK